MTEEQFRRAEELREKISELSSALYYLRYSIQDKYVDKNDKGSHLALLRFFNREKREGDKGKVGPVSMVVFDNDPTNIHGHEILADKEVIDAVVSVYERRLEEHKRQLEEL